MIHRFRVQNFKSIRDVAVDFSPITVLVGKSGTGKTNFVQSLRFLRDLLASHQHLNGPPFRPALGSDDPTSFEIEFSISGIRDKFLYELSIQAGGALASPCEEKLKLGDRCLFHQKHDQKHHGSRWLVEPELLQVPAAGPIAVGRIPSISEVVIAFTALTTGIGCYTFSDSVLGKGGTSQAAPSLNDDASNYLGALKAIVSNLQDLTIRRNMVETLRRVNPSVSSVELNDLQNPSDVIVGHRLNGKTLALTLSQESDGFRRFYAHLLALYQRPPLQTLVFEHPEDGIHPGALSHLADEFKAAPGQGRGQVILTTHSPKLLDQFEPEQIRVVELVGLETRIGPISEEQHDAIREKLLDPGELLTVDPARLQAEETKA